MTITMIADVLGGRKALRSSVDSEPALRALTRRGLPVATVGRLARELEIAEPEIAAAIGIASRTFSRRRSQDARLTQAESDRLVELARTLAYATDVLGSSESARGWMTHPIPALNGEIPLHLMDTSAGVREVNTVLGRIEYGISS